MTGTAPLSNIEIAQRATMKPIVPLGLERLGIPEEHLHPFGRYKAKLALNYCEHLNGRPDGKLVLAKTGADWKIIEPTPMPAEKSDVDDMLFGLTGLRATEVVAEDTRDAASFQLEPARFTATLSAARATCTKNSRRLRAAARHWA